MFQADMIVLYYISALMGIHLVKGIVSSCLKRKRNLSSYFCFSLVLVRGIAKACTGFFQRKRAPAEALVTRASYGDVITREKGTEPLYGGVGSINKLPNVPVPVSSQSVFVVRYFTLFHRFHFVLIKYALQKSTG